MKHLLIFTAFVCLSFSLSSCAILGGGDEEVGTKNKEVKYTPPQSPYRQVLISSADAVWQSGKTGSTIAINSLCNKYQDVSLDNLKKNILAGIENLKIEKTEKVTHSGREAERIIVKGTTDGVPISVSMLIFKKNGCTFDVAYISRTEVFSTELLLFEKFLTTVSVP